MLRGDKEWQPFMDDMHRAIKAEEINIDEKRVLKDIRRAAKKLGYVTINQFSIACAILDNLDIKQGIGDNGEND